MRAQTKVVGEKQVGEGNKTLELLSLRIHVENTRQQLDLHYANLKFREAQPKCDFTRKETHRLKFVT